MKLFLCIFIFSTLVAVQTSAQTYEKTYAQKCEQGQSNKAVDVLADCMDTLKSSNNSAEATTPKCFNPESIKKDGGSPEKQMAKIMGELSDEEVYARLVLAETLASGCPNADVAKGIAWVIQNRVNAKNEKRFGSGRGVAFKEYQFRSSTGACDVAQRQAFLCPTSLGKDWSQNWKNAQEAVRTAMQAGNENNPIGENTYQYFFFKHFDNSKDCAKWKGVTPEWATPAKRVMPKNMSLDPACVGLYK